MTWNPTAFIFADVSSVKQFAILPSTVIYIPVISLTNCSPEILNKTDRIIVINNDQVVQPQMPGKTQRLLANTLLKTTVSSETPDLVVDDREGGPIVCGGEVFCCHGETDGIGYALAERTSCDLYNDADGTVNGDQTDAK